MPKRKRWLVVAGILCLLGLVEALVDSVFDRVLPFPYDTIVVLVTTAVVSVVAAQWAFATIDRLTSAVVERNAELEERNAALRALYGVSLDVSRHSDAQQVLDSVVAHARALLGVDGALIALREGDGGLCLQAGDPPDAFGGPDSGVERSDEERVETLTSFLAPGLTVALATPIRRAGVEVGSLALVTRRPHFFESSEVEIVDALATQAGIALEAARLHEEIQALAVRGERERIAREMHDGLAQVLGYVNTKSQAVGELLEAGRTTDARGQLAELAAAARSVYVDVREAILNLTAPSPDGMNLAEALDDYIRRYAESSKLAARLEVAPDAVGAPLSGAAKAETFRIVREALTNVRKHAGANRVVVSLAREGDRLVVRVTDDGRGFDADLVGVGPENWPHFGLAGMRERAATVDANIQLRSRPGTGTEVELRVPLLRPAARTNGSNGTRRAVVEAIAPVGIRTDVAGGAPDAPVVRGADRLANDEGPRHPNEGD